MKFTPYIVAPITLAVCALSFVVMYSLGLFGVSEASTIVGNDYNSYYISSATASNTKMVTLKTGSGSLGSVVITNKSVDTTYPHLTIYNASSTQATSTATVIAKFGTSTGETAGTYQFDATFSNGLSIEVPSGFNGSYTITWR